MNSELFQLFDHGRDWLQQGRCSSVRPLVNQIVSLMTVPLVQGALRYAYKNSQAGADMASAKNAAEGATFSAAVLPLVHHCNAASAATISENLKFGLFPTGGDADTARYVDAGAVKAAFEGVYACLGITCAHVGSLMGASGAMAQECNPPVKVVTESPYSVTARVTAAGSVTDYGPVVLTALANPSPDPEPNQACPLTLTLTPTPTQP